MMNKEHFERESEILDRQHTQPMGIRPFVVRLVKEKCKECSPVDELVTAIIHAYDYGVMQGKRIERARRQNTME